MKKTARKRQTRSRKENAAGSKRPGRAVTINVILAGILILIFGSLSFERNFVWETKLALWTNAAKNSPLKSRAHNNLGNCYALLGRFFEAIEQYKEALRLDPKNIEVYYNLGIYLEDVGILNQAIHYYDVFCKAAPPLYTEQKQLSCRRAKELSRRTSRQ